MATVAAYDLNPLILPGMAAIDKVATSRIEWLPVVTASPAMYEKRSRIAPTPWIFAKYIISQRLTWHQVTTGDISWQPSANHHKLRISGQNHHSHRSICAGREGLFYKSSIAKIKMIYREFTNMPFMTFTPLVYRTIIHILDSLWNLCHSVYLPSLWKSWRSIYIKSLRGKI